MVYVLLVIVALNLTLIGLMAVLYFRGSVRDDRLAALEEFCAGLPHNVRIPDPCILIREKWVCRSHIDYPHSA